MTNGSKYRIVGWRLLWCSDLFWRLVDDEVDAWLIVCQVMSAPTIVAAVLAMLS
jgi:hypothetical protein